MRSILLILCLLPMCSPVHAALTWEADEISVEAEPLQEEATVTFRFTNSGSEPVTITNIHTSCGCTTPALEKRTYAPGESGDLQAVYAFGDATGNQQKTLTISTDEPEDNVHTLTLKVAIPAIFDIAPRFVMWQQNEPAKAKTITIRALHPELIKPVSVEARDVRFTATLEPAEEDPTLFRVAITPQDTEAGMFTSVIVRTNASDGRHSITVFATVR